MLTKQQRESRHLRRCLVIEYIEQLKAAIEAAGQMERHYFGMYMLYYDRNNTLQSRLLAAKEKLRDDIKWTNFLHYCQTGKYLDEVKPGEWVDFL